jgi:hypothetical protein
MDRVHRSSNVLGGSRTTVNVPTDSTEVLGLGFSLTTVLENPLKLLTL